MDNDIAHGQNLFLFAFTISESLIISGYSARNLCQFIINKAMEKKIAI